MMNPIAYDQALTLLHQASTPFGFVAAVQEHDNYKRVWTRDGVITSIAALLTDDKQLIETAKSTIKTLFDHQHQLGFMPSNVSPSGHAISYGGTAGRADNPSWAVIGLCAYTIFTDDRLLWEKYQQEVNQCFVVMEAWEFNGKHLIYVPQSGDWADEYIQHGYILFEQLLRMWALSLAALLNNNETWKNKAKQIIKSIKNNYWKGHSNEEIYAPNLLHQMAGASNDFWIMGFNPARIYTYFDLQANTFSLLLNLGNDEQNRSVIGWLKSLHTQNKSILPSFYPTIEEEDEDMRELKNNYAYAFRNQPNYFHNGGLWPVWNGWLVSALVLQGEEKFAKDIMYNIHQVNNQEDQFNECFHGINKNPCGVPKCTWSAAGAIIAEQSLKNDLFKKMFNF